MNRREALSHIALLFGGTIIGAEAFLSGCSKTGKKTGLFTDEDIPFLDEVGETILPATASSPGAKAADIGAFMKKMVTDLYEANEQKIFTSGIEKLKSASHKKFNKPFMELSSDEKHDLLVEIDEESRQPSSDSNAPHYFRMMKQLTLWGYFTSEPGATKALRYVAVPGRYDGCIPYKTGDKAWAT